MEDSRVRGGKGRSESAPTYNIQFNKPASDLKLIVLTKVSEFTSGT